MFRGTRPAATALPITRLTATDHKEKFLSGHAIMRGQAITLTVIPAKTRGIVASFPSDTILNRPMETHNTITTLQIGTLKTGPTKATSTTPPRWTKLVGMKAAMRQILAKPSEPGAIFQTPIMGMKGTAWTKV